MLPYLERKTLAVLHRDLTEPEISYGSDLIDKPLWMKFISNIEKEIQERADNAENDE